MEIVGVMHGYESFGRFQPVFPSKSIETIIKDFPKGTKVGIETTPKTKEYFEFMEELSRYGISQRGSEYFDSLKSLCDSNNLEVVYLEDLNSFMEQNNHYKNYAQTEDFNEFMEYFNHFAVKRDITEKEKIKEEHPAISFVGIGHANKWYFDNSFDNAKYMLDVTDGKGNNALFDKSPEFSKKLWQLDKSLDKLCNLYFNKQFGNEKPSFVGTWDVPSLMGYFEIHNKNGKTKMEDFLGSASIEGNISDSKIDFTKQYEDGALSYVQGPIRFMGNGKDGTFKSKENSGEFVLYMPEDIFDNNNFFEVFQFFNEHLSEWKYNSKRMEKLRGEQYPESDISLKPIDDIKDDLPF